MIPTPQVSEDIQDDESYSGCCWSCGMPQDTPLESGDYCGFCGNCSESHEFDMIEYCISCGDKNCPGCCWSCYTPQDNPAKSVNYCESCRLNICDSCGTIDCIGC